MTLTVILPSFCKNESSYITKVLLEDFLGLSFNIQMHDEAFILMKNSAFKETIRIDSTFFRAAHLDWLGNSYLNEINLSEMQLEDELQKIFPSNLNSTKIIFGKPIIKTDESGIHIDFDLFGTCFFLMTRYEEAVLKCKDLHERFPYHETIAFKHGFLNRPMVNEYLLILSYYLKKLWRVELNQPNFQLEISCDVDHPFDTSYLSIYKALRRSGRLLLHGRLDLSVKVFLNYIVKKFDTNNYKFDYLLNNLLWMIKENTKANNSVTFNFIPYQTSNKYDDISYFSSKKMSWVLSKILKGKHIIGIHPGYNSSDNKEILSKSLDLFKRKINTLNISESKITSRMHYLRFNIIKTFEQLSREGIFSDSSMGFPNYPGFRASICYEYKMYNLTKRQTLDILQKPLIIMDDALIGNRGMNLGMTDKAIDKFEEFKTTVQHYNGVLTVLWHNSYFEDFKSREIYRRIIS
tara:strand:- start:15878 stop:17269 length:1392 start_codon:yes stop_codon:yes gene_type:complete